MAQRGLWLLRETFQLFCALEKVVQTYPNALLLPNTAGHQSQFTEELFKSKDVQSYQCIVWMS